MRDTTDEAANAAPDALYRFLTAEPADGNALAPRVVAAVGRERLDEIVDTTLGRVGEVTGVRDSRDGLVIEGTRERALAFAATRDGHELDGLLIAPGAAPPARLRTNWVRPALAWTVLVLLFLRASTPAGRPPPDSLVRPSADRRGRIPGCGGLACPALFPWWIRRPLEAGALVALASAWRLPGLPASGGAPELVVGAALVAVLGVLLMRAQRSRWGTAVSQPLVFPLQGGRWYVGQGGGRQPQPSLRRPRATRRPGRGPGRPGRERAGVTAPAPRARTARTSATSSTGSPCTHPATVRSSPPPITSTTKNPAPSATNPCTATTCGSTRAPRSSSSPICVPAP